MGKADEAAALHAGGSSCSGAVLGAFASEAGLSAPEVSRLAGPMAGGKMIKCGAVLAAEEVLKRKYPKETAEKKIEEFEAAFTGKNQSVVCREIRGLTGKGRLRSCRGCVTDSAEILEEMI